MTYLSKEQSSYGGQPIELLEIRYGEGEDEAVYTTSGDEDVTVGGRLYQAFTTERDGFDDEGNPDDAKQLNIKVPRDHPFILEFDNREFPHMVSVRVKRAHLNDPDLGLFNIWSGRLVGVSYEHPWMTLGCEQVATSLARTGCRIRYMRQCPHTLYMPRCWVDKEAHKLETAVWSVLEGGSVVALSHLPQGVGRFIGGIFQFGNLSRHIVHEELYGHQQQWRVYLSRPLIGLASTDRVVLYPGCDRTAATCNAKFNNLLNYGGFDFIPPKGPFEGVSIV